jgi:hypothetical protein
VDGKGRTFYHFLFHTIKPPIILKELTQPKTVKKKKKKVYLTTRIQTDKNKYASLHISSLPTSLLIISYLPELPNIM